MQGALTCPVADGERRFERDVKSLGPTAVRTSRRRRVSRPMVAAMTVIGSLAVAAPAFGWPVCAC